MDNLNSTRTDIATNHDETTNSTESTNRQEMDLILTDQSTNGDHQSNGHNLALVNQTSTNDQSDKRSSPPPPSAPVQLLVLGLKWWQKDALINCLNQLSALLVYGSKMSKEVKQKLFKDIDDLVLILINLAAKTSEECSILRISDVVLGITIEDRMRFINHLIRNKDLINLCSGATRKVKEDVANENNSLVKRLLDLSILIDPIGSNKVSNFKKCSSPDQDRSVKKVRFDEVTDLKEEIKFLRDQIEDFNNSRDVSSSNLEAKLDEEISELREQIEELVNTKAEAGLETKVDSLKSELDTFKSQDISKVELEAKVESLKSELDTFRSLDASKAELEAKIESLKSELDTFRSKDISKGEVTFTFKVSQISKLLITNKGYQIYSSIFYCRAIPWCMSVKYINQANEDRYLEVYLHCYNSISRAQWLIKTSYEIRLIAQTPAAKDIVKKVDYEFTRDGDYTGWGISKFCKFDDLKNGYMKDDLIMLKIHLEAGKLTVPKMVN